VGGRWEKTAHRRSLQKSFPSQQGLRLERFCARPKSSLLILFTGFFFELFFLFFFFFDFHLLKGILYFLFYFAKKKRFFFKLLKVGAFFFRSMIFRVLLKFDNFIVTMDHRCVGRLILIWMALFEQWLVDHP